MFDAYSANRFGPGRSAVIRQHGAVATSQPLAAQTGLQILRAGSDPGRDGVQSAIRENGNFLDFRLKLRYNIRTNNRFRLKK